MSGHRPYKTLSGPENDWFCTLIKLRHFPNPLLRGFKYSTSKLFIPYKWGHKLQLLKTYLFPGRKGKLNILQLRVFQAQASPKNGDFTCFT